MARLIISGNSVYEVDEQCERLKKEKEQKKSTTYPYSQEKDSKRNRRPR